MIKDTFNLLASGVLTCLSNNEVQKVLEEVHKVSLPGSKIVLAVGSAIVSAVAPNVLNKVAESVTFEKLRHVIQEPGLHKLNHDLEHLIAKSAIRAMGWIKKLFIERLENELIESKLGIYIDFTYEDINTVEDVLNNMQKDLKGYFEIKKNEKKILENPIDNLKEVTEQLFVYTSYLSTGKKRNDNHPIWHRLKQFFKDQLPICFDLAFKEALKDKNNEKERIAFQIWIWEDIQHMVKYNSEQLKQIEKEIADLKKGISKNDKRFRNELSGILNTILANQRELITKVDKVLEGIEDIKTGLSQSTVQKLPKLIQNIDKELFKYAQSVYYDADVKNMDVVSIITKDNLSEKIAEYHKVCVVGEPGMGKSFLARKVVYDIYLTEKLKTDDRKYDIIWWIDADANKVKTELIELAEKVCGKGKVAEWLAKAGTGDAIGNEGVIKELFDELKKRSWLIVFDNAMDIDTATAFGQGLITLRDYAKKYLPETTTKGHLLLTSRNKNWAIRGQIQHPFQPLYLEKWTDKSVKSYLEKPELERPKRKITVNSIEQISIFQGLPLAVTIAKAYILSINKSNRFSIFYDKWEDQFHEIEKETYDIDRKLLTTITVSYQHLPTVLQQFIGVLACFAPDELPVLSLYEPDNNIEDDLDYIERLSLGRYDEAAVPPLYSMHRLVQNCIKQIQPDNTLVTNYKTALRLLARLFNSVFGKDNALISLLLSHADTLADVVRAEQIKLPDDTMTELERNEAAQLFINAGQYHFDVGDNKRAIEQFQSAIIITSDEGLIARAKKSLANVLFLLGGSHLNEAEEYAREAAAHFNKLPNKVDYIDCQNDVVGKILQRKCEFEGCEKVTLSTNVIVQDYIHANVKEGNVFEHIVEKYVRNENDKIAEKQGSIYHNLGSLYWTWGRPGNDGKNDSDYERARSYFFKAIDFQQKMVDALEGAVSRFPDEDAQNRLKVAAGRKTFFLNVSRMIYGAVLGLLKEFGGDKGQWAQHQIAFEDFKNRAFEKRRYAYTAYYMLAYSWDRERLLQELPEKFKEEDLISEVLRHDSVLSGNDEKYDLIKKIVNLREAVRNSEKQNLAGAYYNDLKNQLEAMKYKFNQGGQEVVRYYDVDTCSVSAILDYADFLKTNKEDKASQTVAEYGLDLIYEIEYPRRKELEVLAQQ